MKALVFKEEYQGQQPGDIFMVREDSFIDGYSHHLLEKMEICPVPADIEDKPQSSLKAVYNEIAEQYEIELDDSVDKDIQIQEKYQEMMADIYAQMEVVFGTKSAETANADKQTYELMVANPDDYSGIGLKAKFDVGSINIGDDLDSDALITEYASGKLADIRAYGVYRMQRKLQFDSEKEAILAS